MIKDFTYKQASRYLDECLVFGIKPSLVRINKLLELLENPHKKADFIHVVGTNGKTSTAVLTASILHGQGFRCGFHISPHISEYVERFWFCGSHISKKGFAALLTYIFPFIEKVNGLDLGGPMTQFEIIAAMAFELSAREKLQVLVMEAGMGGRWDATNAADSRIVGLTGVDLEHTEILGKTIKEIASEKVQVIKRDSQVASLSEDREVLAVLEEKVNTMNSRLFLSGKDFKVLRKERKNLDGWMVDIKGIYKNYSGLRVPLLGNYQPYNLSLAVALSELYTVSAGKTILENKLRESLLKVRIMGRFEVLQADPVVIADSSHNPAGIKNFAKNMEENFGDKKKIIIFSVLKDKDYSSMIEAVLPLADTIILTSSSTARSLEIDALEKEVLSAVSALKIKDTPVPGTIYKMDSVSNSLKFALKIAESNDIICITGSITNLEKVFKK